MLRFNINFTDTSGATRIPTVLIVEADVAEAETAARLTL